MQIYLVGGAVRDQLLGLPVKEKDWVVVGATPSEMLAKGFQPVGKDFPVFLHPETHEEYALARTERKTGKGYKGFVFHADAEVTLEEDLKRRDLTINAMAQTDDGEIIDPYDGQQDLKAKRLRHVSDAFAEDPVRILRLARFASKLPDFELDSETLTLMKAMVAAGEVDALVAERVWKECERALNEKQPKRFFEILKQCGAFEILFADITLRDSDYAALNYAAEHESNATVRWSALLAKQDSEKLEALFKRYRLPKEHSEVALMTCRWHSFLHDIKNKSAEDILQFVKSVDVLRRPERFTIFCEACQACYQDTLSTQQDLIEKIVAAIKNIDISKLNDQGLKGKDFADALHQLQLCCIDQVMQ
ncbi:MAG: multifunctional CCA tRNA nucleotidyl transferase/2'3'-cyclic phosphodiesterase/2'nucleotidase/phosphatase [Gammaproteobacteria bacterium]|nr:multifunctional CCA tRNA nucleotidyl transferase/2'3'-cyclic phosphodiesterase/2'nucleotidase/phosphatase [Gammaproteobacteria bacterium]MCH9744333.1 multifunctional CCA tRNA nucleotidyl transferase/2'3'-cyclic phosphodiesterase/2'nucleotidase/phosphatase [Gammaproteobacteria bacterium]